MITIIKGTISIIKLYVLMTFTAYGFRRLDKDTDNIMRRASKIFDKDKVE